MKCTDSTSLEYSCVQCVSACERDGADWFRFIPGLGSFVFDEFVLLVVLVMMLT